MTSTDCLVLLTQLAPDLSQTEAAKLNFIDRANKRIVRELLWPDCWMTTMTVENQQEYQTPAILKLYAAYVGGQLCTQTTPAILEGRQVLLYDQGAGGSPQSAFVNPVPATGYVQVSGPITTGDTLTTFVNGIPVLYTVKVTDTDLTILATSIANAITLSPWVSSIVLAAGVPATPGQVSLTATALGGEGNLVAISVTASGGATETFVASGATLTGGSGGSGAAPGTLGPWAPYWAMQEPMPYPVVNYYQGAIRPDAQPWGPGPNQPPRYYWRGGSIAIVPNTSSAGVEISLSCVRQPDTITVPGQVLTSPDMYLDAIAWSAIAYARFSNADARSIQLSQMAESAYTQCKKDLIAWKASFQGDMNNGPKLLTQRARMGLGNRVRGKRGC